jgi:hypothetical protein
LWAPRFDLQLDDVWIQQVIGRAVIAMFILDAEEQRELMIRPEVQFERRKAGPSAIIDTLGIFAALATRLPISFEHRAATIIKGCELRRGQRGRSRASPPASLMQPAFHSAVRRLIANALRITRLQGACSRP